MTTQRDPDPFEEAFQHFLQPDSSSKNPAKPDCASLDELCELVMGTLPSAQAEKINQHLLVCAPCRAMHYTVQAFTPGK